MVDMTAHRYNTHVPLRPPLTFGASYDYTAPGSPILTRLGDAVGLTVDTGSQPHVSGFSDYYPWKGMRRVNLVIESGDVYAVHGDLNDAGGTLYEDTTTIYQTMVEIPKFWVKFVQTGNVLSYYISPYPLKGYRLHPAFTRFPGTLDHIYVGAFEAIKDVTNRLYSRGGATPTTTTTRATFRTAVDLSRSSDDPGYGWQLMDINTWSAIQLLYLVEYAHMDSQTPSGSTAIGGLGDGLVHIAAKTDTGWTGSSHTDLGNYSGRVAVSGADYAISYRGIENPWGNTNTWLEGINVDTNRWPWVSPYDEVFSDDVLGTTGYRPVYGALPAASGYVTYPAFAYAFNESCQFLPVGTGGAGDTYMCDYYQIDATHGFAAVKVPRVGGAYNQATPAHAGIFYMDVALELAESNANTGARIQYTPYDSTGIYRYW